MLLIKTLYNLRNENIEIRQYDFHEDEMDYNDPQTHFHHMLKHIVDHVE